MAQKASRQRQTIQWTTQATPDKPTGNTGNTQTEMPDRFENGRQPQHHGNEQEIPQDKDHQTVHVAIRTIPDKPTGNVKPTHITLDKPTDGTRSHPYNTRQANRRRNKTTGEHKDKQATRQKNGQTTNIN